MAANRFEPLFSPRSVVIVGSVRENKIAHQVALQMTRGGYSGAIYSVNPGRMTPPGCPGAIPFADLSELPAVPDLAVLAVPARFAAETVAGCGRKGIPFAVVLTSGFSEIGNREEERRLAETARCGGVRLIGPNCAGIMSTPANLFASIEVRALPGRTALVSQSGAVGAAILAMAGERGIGFSRFVSFGNRADIDENELIDFFLHDSDTGILAVYLESVRDGRRFLDAASRFTAGKPLVLIKAGRSQAGMRAASSHTGSMAGSDRVFDTACRRAGIVRVAGIEELLDLCTGFEHYPLPAGNRLCIVTNSGGPGILTTDRAEEEGLSLPRPSEGLRRRLAVSLLPNASLNNPIDLTVEGTREHYAAAITAALGGGYVSGGPAAGGAAPGSAVPEGAVPEGTARVAGYADASGGGDSPAEYDAVIAINVSTPFLDSRDLAEGIVSGRDGSLAVDRDDLLKAVGDSGANNADRSNLSIKNNRIKGKPVIPIFMAGEMIRTGAELLGAKGMPTIPTGERAAAVIAAMDRYRRMRGKLRRDEGGQSTHEGPAASSPNSTEANAPPVTAGIPVAAEFLEPDQVRFLRERGFPLPRGWFIPAGAGDAAAAANAASAGAIAVGAAGIEGMAGAGAGADGRVPDLVPAELAASLSWPLVMKVVSPRIIHKSDYGGVRLGIRNREELAESFRDMNGRLASYDFRGTMVYEQVSGGEELILGARRDPDFGPVILAGAGGILSELMDDSALRIAPVSAEEAEEMVSELRISRIIDGYRGKKPLDRRALVSLIAQLSDLVVTSPWIAEIDLNPVFLFEAGALVGDVRIIPE